MTCGLRDLIALNLGSLALLIIGAILIWRGVEFSRDAVAIKDLSTEKQDEVPREQAVAWLRAHREFDR